MPPAPADSRPAPEPAPSTEVARAAYRRMWAELAPIGRDEASGGYRRFAWSAADLELRAWFAAEVAARELDLTVDGNGNQWAWWSPEGAAEAARPGIVLGSHLDSVPDGGAFDGPLGVVSALAAIDVLQARGYLPRVPLGVVNFSDEEGARFGIACLGSRLLTGVLTPDRARALTDGDGITLADALVAAGRDPETLGADPDALARIGTYVELHIEQGRLLSTLDDDSPLAAGTHIWPHGRWRIDVPGEANHAGTTRLEDRDDALLGVAAAVIAARRLAEEHGALATIGKVEVEPGGVNAIPSRATAWLDARASDAAAVQALVAALGEVLDDFGATITQESWTPATEFDPDLARTIGGVLTEHAETVPLIGTGAGHDAGILTNAGVRAGMIFVRNPTGVSHAPAEFAEEGDCVTGILALADVAAQLAGHAAETDSPDPAAAEAP